jgi:hypothetical protein
MAALAAHTPVTSSTTSAQVPALEAGGGRSTFRPPSTSRCTWRASRVAENLNQDDDDGGEHQMLPSSFFAAGFTAG